MWSRLLFLFPLIVLTLFRARAADSLSQQFRSNDLPAPAKKVWTKTSFPHTSENVVQWLSDQTIVYESSKTTGVLLRRYNITTGKETILDILNDQIDRRHASTTGWYPFSPDGSKVLCSTERGICILGLDGAMIGPAAPASYESGAISWLSNSREWVEFRMDRKKTRYVAAWVHAVDETTPVKKLPLKPAVACDMYDGSPMPLDDGSIIIRQMRLRWVEDGDTSTGTIDLTERVRFVILTFLTDSVRTRVISVRLPVVNSYAEPFVSSKGDRLVWRVRPSIARLRRESLWASQIDGTSARELLEVE